MKTLFFALFFFVLFNANSLTRTAVANGAWGTNTTWSGSTVPACGDSIVIPASITVTITADADYTACNPTTQYLKITIFGCLKFVNGNRLKLPCNSRIYVMPGPPTGSIVPGVGGGSSTFIELCNSNVWTAAMGTFTGGCLPPGLPGCSAVLPITLLDFSATLKENKMDLLWSTATEKNNSHFEVERAPDAIAFVPIQTIPSKAPNGNSSIKLDYTATDEDPINNVSYYRLKQVDYDLTPSYSKIVSVNVAKAKNIKFLVYPNPNNGEFTVDISGLENNHQILVDLKNLRGVTVYESSFYLQEVSNKIQIIPSSKLPKGIYTCTFTIEEIQYSVKVVVS
ncbi:MAG: T9SS type A sorting domain-containing protein [Bacteroidetes bacterium]|nr:T9SS type A sorting domain-containing protein [Bacteroidota bacterium]